MMTLSWMTIVPLEPMICRTTPFHASRPASVTTKLGTPIRANQKPWKSPMAVPAPMAAISAGAVAHSAPPGRRWCSCHRLLLHAGHALELAGGDRLDDLALRGLGALVLPDHAAEAQDRDVVGDLEDVVHVVGDEDHGEPVLGQALDEIEHL